MSSDTLSREIAATRAKEQYLVPKELSWLDFNERVLQEANDSSVPLMQRLRFLGIFANNLHEFFQVRVADVSRLAEFSSRKEDKRYYRALLASIQGRCRELQALFDSSFKSVCRLLADNGVFLLDASTLSERQALFVRDYFYQHLLPILSPVLLDHKSPMPTLRDGSLHLAIRIRTGNGKIRYAILEIPCPRLPRFVKLPRTRSGEHAFMLLENIVKLHLRAVFRNTFAIEEVQAFAFTVTMDAELELGEGINQSLIRRVAASLKRRQSQARVERFSYDRNMPDDLLQLLQGKLKIGPYDSMTAGGPYQRARDLMDFPAVSAALEYRPFKASNIQTTSGGNAFDLIRQDDLLLFYPYQSFDFTLALLRTAAIDPAVTRIQISLYRLAPQSQVVDALINARCNQKSVCAVVEIQARFDEEANINWGRRLEAAGVEVIYGYPGLKVHSKLILIQRRERGSLRYYSHVGTGNFNEKTAHTYSDLSLFTYDQEVGAEIDAVFQFIQGKNSAPQFRELLVSPHNTRSRLLALIEAERMNALAGVAASIELKCNNLVDRKVIQRLYRASQAGVKIRIICRSMCSLVPAVPGLSDNIEVINIVDRFLEHARFYIFHNGGEPIYYLGSADLMTRNLDHRIEASIAVRKPQLKHLLQNIFDIQWCDTQKARRVNARPRRHNPDTEQGLRSQLALHRYIRSGRLPAQVRRFQRSWRALLEAEAQARRAQDAATLNFSSNSLSELEDKEELI